MSNFKYLNLEINGSSHSEYIEVILDNLPQGYLIDFEEINKELLRRRPNGITSTSRIEKDEYEVLSGIVNGCTDGNRIVVHIFNKNIKKKDYDDVLEIVRPSHADLVSYLTTGKIETGGGKFSGRLTVGLVFVGAVCKQILRQFHIELYTLINQIGTVKTNTSYIDRLTSEMINKIKDSNLPVLNKEDYSLFEQEIIKHKERNDSCGGSITTYIKGVNPGFGGAYFDSLKGYLSYLVFSIPAVKAVSFGIGNDFKEYSGSVVNDEIYCENEKIKFYHNYNGGINGGISNGDDIIVNATFKPTPTISLPQRTINVKTKENVIHTFSGRHDPCIVLRGYVVIEAILAFGILDILLEKECKLCED